MAAPVHDPRQSRRFKKMLEEVFLLDAEGLPDSCTPDQIKTWDSMATLVLAAAVEHYFQVQLDVKEIAAIRNIGDLRSRLRRKGVLV